VLVPSVLALSMLMLLTALALLASLVHPAQAPHRLVPRPPGW
jgi:hypothetical protein